ncbi:lipopolysaccharide biosynthesis protein [Marinobacter salsuginis]|uniref:lipopolysaccharide biosynthesis protein n=1 Tax=Marinobacter salsuginis TaxID=418719 RepID=UPI00273E1F8B|nr:lipopolysaccharide biosynthesis protein [Marinobacter salsuginis]
MANVRQAVLFSFATRYSAMIVGLVSAMLVARLLTPDEIGTFAIASAIVMVMSEFRLLGAGMYLVRENELTHAKIRSATGLTILISWGMGLGIWTAAPAIAAFYQLEPIKVIFRILSISFFLAPAISIPTALLTRDFRFRQLFIVRICTSITNLASTLALIMLGYSYYALAWGYTLAVIAEFFLIFFFRPQGMPWTPNFRNLGPIARFGIYNSLAGFFRRGVVTAPDMIIGKMGTTTQVGLFSRGLGFIEFVSQTLMMGVKPVVLPYLSQVQRSGDNVNDAYIAATVLLGGIIWPILAVASVVSLPAIRLFFGDQWDAAAPYATLIAYWAMFRSVHWFSSDLLVAKGKEKLMVFKEGGMFVLYISGIALAFPSGLMAVASVFTVAGLVDLVLTTWLLTRFVGLQPLRMARAWLPNLAVTALCWGAAWLIFNNGELVAKGVPNAFWAVAAILPLVWVMVIFVFRHPLKQEVIVFLRWFANHWPRPRS